MASRSSRQGDDRQSDGLSERANLDDGCRRVHRDRRKRRRRSSEGSSRRDDKGYRRLERASRRSEEPESRKRDREDEGESGRVQQGIRGRRVERCDQQCSPAAESNYGRLKASSKEKKLCSRSRGRSPIEDKEEGQSRHHHRRGSSSSSFSEHRHHRPTSSSHHSTQTRKAHQDRHTELDDKQERREEEKKRKHHDHRKSKHRRKKPRSSSSSSSSRDHSREERRKRRKKKERKKHQGASVLAMTQQWGKHGVIQVCDKWSKKQEFQLWLMDVKGVGLETLSQGEEKSLFSEYMEDYNTATLPHEKYYNLEKWEKIQFNQPAELSASSTTEFFDDEKQRVKEIEQIRSQRKMNELRAAYQDMKSDAEKVDAMKEQKILENQMKILFRMGRIEEGNKIRERLKPDEEH